VAIKAGQTVKFKPEFMDPGDENLTFVAIDDEEKGRVTIQAISDLPFPPNQVVPVHMIASVE
jgi:hypothetical protein